MFYLPFDEEKQRTRNVYMTRTRETPTVDGTCQLERSENDLKKSGKNQARKCDSIRTVSTYQRR